MSGNNRFVNNINKVSSYDFKNLTSLKVLRMSFCSIQIVEEEAFRTLPLLEELHLSNNRITSVSKLSFKGMGKLKLLDLSNNVNLNIESTAFQDLTNLEKLFLGEIDLQNISNKLFTYLTKLVTLDIHGNNIIEFEYNFFARLTTLQYLDISGNDLEALPVENYDVLSNITTIYGGGNPWQCNCEMIPLKNFKNGIAYRPMSPAQTIYCKSPLKLRDMALIDVDDSELLCSGPTGIRCDKLDLETLHGTEVNVSCILQGGDPKPYLRVTRPDGYVISYRNQSISGYTASKYGIFRINSATQVDNGVWTFTATNRYEKDISTVIPFSILSITSTTTLHSTSSTSSINTNIKATKNTNTTKTTKKLLKLRKPLHRQTLDKRLNVGMLIAVGCGSSFITIITCLIIIFLCKKSTNNYKNRIRTIYKKESISVGLRL